MKEDPKYSEEIVEVPRMEYVGKYIKIQTFTLPDGREERWESSAYIPARSGIVVAGLTPQGKLILVSIYRLPIRMRDVELPGGVAEEGEDLQEAARREFLEETGYSSNHFEKIGQAYMWAGGTDLEYTIYYAKDCEKKSEPTLDPVEKFLGLEVVKADPREVIKEIAGGSNKYHSPLFQALLILISKGEIKI